jgi:hypothetical protein
LFRPGWRRDSMKVGAEVTVRGYQARDASKTRDAGF